MWAIIREEEKEEEGEGEEEEEEDEEEEENQKRKKNFGRTEALPPVSNRLLKRRAQKTYNMELFCV